MLMIWLQLAAFALVLVLLVVTIAGQPWLDSFRAANWRRELSDAFQFGYRAGKADGERKRDAVK